MDMVNAIFIDYTTLLASLDNGFSSFDSACYALKDAVKKFDNIRIVCLNTIEDFEKKFDYSFWLNEISQKLNLKKSRFFDVIKLSSWDEAPGKVSSWMSVNEVKAFAIVVRGQNAESLAKSYANNVICCDQFSEATAKDVYWLLSNYKNAVLADDNLFITSDSHFCHTNIIKYCNRPWNSGKDEAGNIIVTEDDVKHMDEEMVKRWNSVVGKNSIVYHLGDFSFGGKETAERIFPQLNGKIRLVMGNHDHYKVKWYYDLGFDRVYDKTIIINDFVILSHAPLMFLNENTPFFNIYGHVHDSPMYKTWSKTGCCVCVERHDYTPVSWRKIKEMYDRMNADEQ